MATAGFNVTAPLLGNKGQPGKDHSTYKQMMDQDLGKNIDFLFKVMVKKAQSMMPGKENDTDLSSTVLQVASTIQQAKTNQSMDELTQINRGSYSLSVMNMAGQTVEHKSSILNFDGTPQEISAMLPNNVKSAEVMILDKSLQLIKSIRIPTTAGRQTIQWDGLDSLEKVANNGTYIVKVKAVDENGKLKPVDTYVGSLITGTEFSENGTPQLLSGNTKINEFYRIQRPLKQTTSEHLRSRSVDHTV